MSSTGTHDKSTDTRASAHTCTHANARARRTSKSSEQAQAHTKKHKHTREHKHTSTQTNTKRQAHKRTNQQKHKTKPITKENKNHKNTRDERETTASEQTCFLFLRQGLSKSWLIRWQCSCRRLGTVQRTCRMADGEGHTQKEDKNWQKTCPSLTSMKPRRHFQGRVVLFKAAFSAQENVRENSFARGEGEGDTTRRRGKRNALVRDLSRQGEHAVDQGQVLCPQIHQAVHLCPGNDEQVHSRLGKGIVDNHEFVFLDIQLVAVGGAGYFCSPCPPTCTEKKNRTHRWFSG